MTLRHCVSCLSGVALVLHFSLCFGGTQTVVELLRALEATGVEILYSSDLVPPDLPAVTTPGTAADAQSQAVAALAAYHLTLKNDGPRRFIVTRTAAPAPAAPPPKNTTDAPPLNEVAVFASRYALIGSEIGGPLSLDRDDLQRTPGSEEDSLRAIRTVPGLANSLSSRPFVRGAFLEDVLVRFDGIPLEDPFHFKNFQGLISAFDPATVDRIDVFTGGFPVRYGTRSAGVIDIAPRSQTSGYENRVGASLYSYGASTVGRADELPVEWLASIRHSTQILSLQPRDGDIGEPSYLDTLGRLRWQVNPEFALTLGWMLLDDRVQLSADPSNEQANAHDRDVYSWVAANWDPVGALHSRTSIAVTSSERGLLGGIAAGTAANGQLQQRTDISTVDVRTEWTYLQASALLWDAGAEMTVEHADLAFARQESFDPLLAAELGRPAITAENLSQNLRSTSLGFFGSGRWQWRAFEVEIGARFDSQHYRDLGTRSQATPRINLRFDPTSQWHLYGSWGQFTQAQRPGEWRLEQQQTQPDSANRAVHLIAGAVYDSSSHTHWRLEAYDDHWTSVHPYFDNLLDRLSLIPELGIDRTLVTPSSAESAGLELSVHHSFAAAWEISAAYALSRVTDDILGQDILRSWDQTHALNLNLNWHHTNASAAVLLGWHTGWPRTPLTQTESAIESVLIGPRNSARWGSYFSADVKVAYTAPVSFGNLVFWADATNIANRGNECCSVIGAAGATGNGIGAISTDWFPRVVNVGFEWRFGKGH
ncbi:MAG TPA: TonB-dependent receptor [Steroidobacteraceae bacterium]|nr:TonB-dependent receptor [Steroidobacteraceae bacterium]